jgi:protein involved in polysaccharide export with SLBB domain
VKALAAFGSAGADHSDRIDPSDVLMINATKVVPKSPHPIEPFDGLLIRADRVPAGYAIDDVFVVNPDGKINLGSKYGEVRVGRLPIEEAERDITIHILKRITGKDPFDERNPVSVSVSLAFAAGAQQIVGEHLVGLDGRVNLGTYGSVHVAGKSVDEARAAIEAQLAEYLEKPEVMIDNWADVGARNYAKEAAEAILEIAKQYDWRTEPGQRPNNLQEAILNALVGGDDTLHAVPPRVWFPMVMQQVRAGDNAMQKLAVWILRYFYRLDGDVAFATQSLLELSRSPSPPLREAALGALVVADRQLTDPQIVARLQEMLQGRDIDQIVDALESLRSASVPAPFDASPLLFHAHEGVRRAARRSIRQLRPKQETDIVQFLLKVVQDPDRSPDHVAAIRGLAALEESAMPAYAVLDKLMMDREQPLATRIAAMNALARIAGGAYPSFRNRLQQDVKSENESREETPEFRAELEQLGRAIEEENNAVR